MRKISLLLIMFILCISLASAANFETEITIIKDSINLDESAQFLITIKSNSSNQEEFRIYSPDVEWNVPTKTLIVQPKVDISEEIEITPTKHITSGVYGVHLNIRQESTNTLEEKLLFINVQGDGGSSYKPSVKMEADMTRQADPREPFTIRINLENQNPLNLSELRLIISSDLQKLNTEQVVELNSLEQKVVSLSYEFDNNQQPKAYQVSFSLISGNETIATAETRTLEIISVIPEFTVGEEHKTSFLKTTSVYTYTNDGNIRNTQKVKIPVTWFESKFTRSEGTVEKIDGQRYITKEIELGPNESSSITKITNYMPVLYIIIVIALALIIYAVFRKRLKVSKSVANVSTEEGGISQMKIMIEIVNTSNKELKDVKVVDIVPTIADIKREFGEGTLKPSSILKHSSKGTVLKWNIPELAPGEERLISYDIITKLSIIGSFNLPKTRIQYIKDGKEKTIYSNIVGVSP